MFGMSQENERRYMDEQSKRYMLVLNSHFAAYRDKYQRGGDFRIYSDLLRVRPVARAPASGHRHHHCTKALT